MALSVMQGKVLVATLVSSTSATTLYQVPALSTATLSQGTVCNTSGSTVTFSLNLVPNSGAVGAGNRVVSAYSLAAGDTLSLAEYLGNARMEAGAFLSITAGTSGALAVTVSGLEGS